jgi:hypothetical protein
MANTNRERAHYEAGIRQCMQTKVMLHISLVSLAIPAVAVHFSSREQQYVRKVC